jgi:hypothetical protein
MLPQQGGLQIITLIKIMDSTEAGTNDLSGDSPLTDILAEFELLKFAF